MKGILLLSTRYILFNKGKFCILVSCLSVLMLLPLSINVLVGHYNKVLKERALSTPMLIGARGNRYDLALKSLYQYTDYAETIHMGDVKFIRDSKMGEPLPLHIRYTAQRFFEDNQKITTNPIQPVVGTEMAYFKFRNLNIAEGTPPLFLGDAVAGYEAARKLGLKPGDYVLTTPKSAYDQSQSFQLKMPIVGVLEKTGTADDEVIFTDLKTTWVIDGIGHGHENLLGKDDSSKINSDLSTDSNIVITEKVIQYQEITDENRESFHFHGPPKDFPLTSLIYLPASKKHRIIAQAYYKKHPTRMLLIPTRVMDELMGFVFKIKSFINANYTVISFSVLFLTGLIFLLSYKLRKQEFTTMFKMGGSRQTIFLLAFTEILMVLITSTILAALGLYCIILSSPWLMGKFL